MDQSFVFTCPTAEDTQALAMAIGKVTKGGDIIELLSDLGGGKTTFVKGLARGMGITDVVQSPTFTISQLYKTPDGRELHHFDFYRLDEPGVMRAELAESLHQPNAVVVIEWGNIVHDILPGSRMTIRLQVPGEQEARVISLKHPPQHIAKALYKYQQHRKLA